MRIIHIPAQLTDGVIDSPRAVNHATPRALGLIVAALPGSGVHLVRLRARVCLRASPSAAADGIDTEWKRFLDAR